MNAVKEYVESSQMQIRANIDFIDEFENEISEMHGHCIDIGCGPGVVTRRYLLPKLPGDATIVGCDISRRMIDYAKTMNVDEGRISFVELDIQTERLPSNQIGAYDNALSFYCIHWCQNIRKVFENIYQLLRPGGKVLVNFIAHHSCYDIMMRLQKNPKYASYMEDASKYVPFFQHCTEPRTKLRAILKECGFQVIHCSVRDKTYEQENLQAIKKFVQALNPFSVRMPTNLRDEFENDFSYEFIKEKPSFDHSGQQGNVMDIYQLFIVYMKKN